MNLCLTQMILKGVKW